jgi:hypothetical protein
VVLDNHYPAWQAAVNGHSTPIYRANHTFRAIAVPAGEHTVTFHYAPEALRTGALISVVVLTALVALVLAGGLTTGFAARPVGGDDGRLAARQAGEVGAGPQERAPA